MATINLKPEVGTQLADALTHFCDDTLMETVTSAYGAVSTLGDENHLVVSFKEKFLAFQSKYNDLFVPVCNKCKAEFENFTDIASYIAKLQVDTGIKDADVGTIATGRFDPARAI